MKPSILVNFLSIIFVGTLDLIEMRESRDYYRSRGRLHPCAWAAKLVGEYILVLMDRICFLVLTLHKIYYFIYRSGK